MMGLPPLLEDSLDILKTPYLVVDPKKAAKNYKRLVQAFSGDVVVYYAVKANSHVEILKHLRREGSSFDVASIGEIMKLIKLGVRPDRMSFGNTIKRVEDIDTAYTMGIDLFAVDSEMEIDKIARVAPRSRVFVRIHTSGLESDWPLSGKFGADVDHAVELVDWARFRGLKPIGVSFHVGSQNYNPKNWEIAIKDASKVFIRAAKEHHIILDFLNTGGGWPVRHTKPIPSVEEIASVIVESTKKYIGSGVLIATEPGRYMVGDAGILVSSVVLRSRRLGKDWIYIDAGVFHGLMETIENFRYEVVVYGKEDFPKKTFALAGPTCDSVDVIYDEIELPENTTIGDKVLFINSGAYTVEYGTNFNGIPSPPVYTIEQLKKINEMIETA